MARLLAFGGDNGHKALSELDSVDLEAIRLVHAFGWDSDPPKNTWTFSPCPREHCGGAIVDGWGMAGCMLCGR
jgi:hypothetical protein